MSQTCKFEIKDYPSWTKLYMPHSRLIQICAIFYPEIKKSTEGDKCHQIQNAIKHLNAAAAWTFIPGKEMSFDEGGISKKSNYNIVRQYNNSKPN